MDYNYSNNHIEQNTSSSLEKSSVPLEIEKKLLKMKTQFQFFQICFTTILQIFIFTLYSIKLSLMFIKLRIYKISENIFRIK